MAFGNHHLHLHLVNLLTMIPPIPLCVAGKRTFTSFVSKVKAKVQEFDQNRYADILFSRGTVPPSLSCFRGSGGRGQTSIIHFIPFIPTSTPYRNTQTPSSPGASTATGYAVGQLPSPVLDRHAQQAYYAPRAVHNARQGSISDESQSELCLPTPCFHAVSVEVLAITTL